MSCEFVLLDITLFLFKAFKCHIFVHRLPWYFIIVVLYPDYPNVEVLCLTYGRNKKNDKKKV